MRAIGWAALAALVGGCALNKYDSQPGGDLLRRLGLSKAEPPAEAKAGSASPEQKAELNQAVLLISQQQYNEAAEKLMNLIPRLLTSGDRPATAEGTFWLGYCREKQNRLEEAGECYRKVIEDFKDTPAAREAEERLNNLAGRVI